MSRARDRKPRLVERPMERKVERKPELKVERPAEHSVEGLEPALMPADERRFLRVLIDGVRGWLSDVVRLLRAQLRGGRGLRLLIGTAIVAVLLPVLLW